MSSPIIKFTVDSFGFVPRLWQVWDDPTRGPMRCIAVEKGGSIDSPRFHITAEFLPRGWKVGGAS